MGRIAAPFGIKGWVKIQADAGNGVSLLDYDNWWLGREGDWRQKRVLASAPSGKGLVAQFEGCEDRDGAGRLRGLQIALPRSAFPPAGENEYYWVDLIGLEVVNTAGESLGRVDSLMETGANEVLVVKGRRERLIPFVGAVIREVDLAAGVVRVEWGSDY